MDPSITDIIADPACGTAGFLVSALHNHQKRYTSKDGQIEHDGQVVYTMDKLSPAEKKHLTTDMFYGFDFDVTMLRISAGWHARMISGTIPRRTNLTTA